LASVAFPASGYYLLQSGHHNDPATLSIAVDCGELGYQSIAAHGHADALSFTLRAFGLDVLVDPGTFDYFTYPEWRRYFRSTRAHNTATVDDADQSVMLGPFMWGQRAAARCLAWDPSQRVWSGAHDGYMRLPDPVRHERRIAINPDNRELAIVDRFEAREEHSYSLWFHAAPECTVQQTAAGEIDIVTGRGAAHLKLDPALSVTLYHGSTQPIAGWVSRNYHVKSPATTIQASARATGLVAFTCTISLEAREGSAF
jgi:uncharacterized heparinase superfamily protein